MTGRLEQHLNGRTLYVVSDLHMGDGSAKDNFAEYRGRFEDFLGRVVERDPNGCLVLAGDVFEFWQSMHGQVVRTYLDLLRRLVQNRSVFIVGNHDIDLLGFVGLTVDSPLIVLLTDRVLLERGGRNFWICHGHEFDGLNDPAKAMILGRIVTLAAGQAEMWLGPKVGVESTESFLEKASLAVLSWMARRYRSWFGRTAGEKSGTGKEIDKTRVALDKYHLEHPDQILVAGHTHQAGWYGDWYVNAGSWQGSQANYVRITPEGQVALHKWPGGEIDETRLWPTGG